METTMQELPNTAKQCVALYLVTAAVL